MKISLLSGAYKNVGDFLIVKRCKEILVNQFPGCEIFEYKRNAPLDENLCDINKTDILITGGGPAYVTNMYPDVIPFVQDLNLIKVPIFAMAHGWHGSDDSPNSTYNYIFSPQTNTLLSRIQNDGFSFGCRDFYTTKVLRNNGYNNVLMTGCAAWYDLKYINDEDIHNNGEIKKICISDPALIINHKQMIDVCKYIRNKFGNAEIVVVFHRGIKADILTSKQFADSAEHICMELKKMGITFEDISYDCKKLEIYNKCDLHIGYRVHAHIYNLSQRRRSILIEEDSRGAGVNEALGLPRVLAYDRKKIANNQIVRRISNKIGIKNDRSMYIIEEIENILQEMENNDYIQFKWAFQRMNYYYSIMKKHLKQVELK